MGYSIDSVQDDCYPDSNVLINKLDIREEAALHESELLIVGLKNLQFELSPFDGKLDFLYYKQIHRFLFDELYAWAGEVRTINLSKQHTVFCSSNEIEHLGEKMFNRIAQMDYLMHLPRNQFIVELADFYASLNYLHPFREGNGRCQRLYFRELARRANHPIDFSKVDSDRMMLATIHAASGVQDTLISVFEEITE